MAFEILDFDEIYNIEWKNSTLRDNFVSIKLIIYFFLKNIAMEGVI